MRTIQSKWKFRPALMSEQNSGEIITVPNESFTIKQILQKFTRGVDPMLTKIGEFDGDEDDEINVNPIRNPDFDLSDMEEVKDFIEDAKHNYAHNEKRVRESKQADKSQPADKDTVK